MSHEPIICEKHGMTSCLDCYRPTMVKIEIEPTPEEFWASLTPERRLALTKAAPRVAGRWEEKWAESGTGCFVRTGPSGLFVAVVRLSSHLGPWTCAIGAVDGTEMMRATIPLAQSACDAELIRRGYVLEEPEG